MSKNRAVKLKDVISTKIQNGYSPLCQEDFSGAWVLSLGALTGYSFDSSQIKAVSSSVKIPEEYRLKNNDILVSRSNTLDKVGRCGVFHGEIENCFYPDLMMRFRANESLVLTKYLETVLQSQFGRKYFQERAAGTSVSMMKINKKILEDFSFPLPSLNEQEKIIEITQIWDSAIEKTEKLIEKKEALLNWYAKRILISGKTSKVLFSDLFKLSSEKNTLNQSYPALSVTKDGVVFQEEYFNKRVASEDTSNYLIARRNTFVFSGLNFWMGSVDLQTLTDVGIISPAYKVFSINSDLISYEYAHFLIRSNYMKRLLMDSSIVGASIVRRNLDMDNLLNSAIELPSLEQQSKIVEQLSIIQKDIELNKMLLNQYKLQKQGLMQKLLTGEWRVK